MAALDPVHLFDQADQLAKPPAAGAPRQANVRRAVSTAYYGLFHFCLREVADHFVGVTHTSRTSNRYALVYRSIDHRTLRDVCRAVSSRTPSKPYAPYVPAGGFEAGVQAFATAAVNLQEMRHRADYDPTAWFSMSEAKHAISTARSAVAFFPARDVRGIIQENRRSFLTLLLCPPR